MTRHSDTDSAYVLHSRRFRETSLIVELLTGQHGRIALVARGAMGGKQRLSETLQPFRLLQIEWRGRSELATLIRSEPAARPITLVGQRLFSAFYLNELIMRFSERSDPGHDLFVIYAAALRALADDEGLEMVLRRFEVALLHHCGYGLVLNEVADSQTPIEAEQRYHYEIDTGAVVVPITPRAIPVQGATLLALDGRLPFSAAALVDAKRLLRRVIQHYIGDRPLAARSLFMKTPGTE